MKLRQCILTRNDCYRSGRVLKPKGVMVHSTAANNPRVSRYVPGDAEIGYNSSGNHWDQTSAEYQKRFGKRLKKCVHAFVGKFADGSIGTVQTLPWAMRGWHCAGNGNNTHIGFEICEDGLEDPVYFGKVYREAVELTAYLCKKFGLDPLKDGVVICHSEGHKRGIASNHADVMHWFPRFGKDMDDFRREVAEEMEDDDMTGKDIVDKLSDEEAYAILDKAQRYAKTLTEPEWSQKKGHWKRATEAGAVNGEAPEGLMKRDEMIAVLGRKGLLD